MWQKPNGYPDLETPSRVLSIQTDLTLSGRFGVQDTALDLGGSTGDVNYSIMGKRPALPRYNIH